MTCLNQIAGPVYGLVKVLNHHTLNKVFKGKSVNELTFVKMEKTIRSLCGCLGWEREGGREGEGEGEGGGERGEVGREEGRGEREGGREKWLSALYR